MASPNERHAFQSFCVELGPGRDPKGPLRRPMAEDRKDLAYINKTLTVPLLYVVT
jgi:hypothetical protein